LDRNLAHAQAGVLATAKIAMGRAEETEGHVREGIRLSPRDGYLYIWGMLGGLANLCLGDDDAAVGWLRRSIEANRNFPMTQFLLASALAQLGRQESATAAVDAGLALDPAFTVGRLRNMLTAMGDNPTYQVQVERIFDGLHKAGVPEG
jgi:tetratricopeptide (TPR) repeat protein